jgi:tRNA(Ile)-lysidine synthase
MENFLQKTAQTIYQHDLIRPGEKVLVALSGGPDSVALLHALIYVAPQLNITVAAAHIDHGLRKSSVEDSRFCAELCKFHNIRIHIKRVNVKRIAEKQKIGVEECGRGVRYSYFKVLCERYGYDKIATGHTADDLAETFLMNLIRGANLGGLSGIMIQRDNIVRPLLECSKTEVLAFLKRYGLSYREDESNRKTEYRRNLIRHKVLPQLAKINPGVSKHIAAAAEAIGQNYIFTQRIVDEVYKQCVVEQTPSQITLDLKRLSGYYKFLGSWVLVKAYLILSGEDYRPGSQAIRRALNLNRNGTLVNLSPEISAVRYADRLTLYRPSGKLKSRILKIGDLTFLGKSGFVIASETTGNANYTEIINNRDENQAFLDYSKVGRLEVRNLKAGDKFKPLGMFGTKKLVDFLNDKKVPSRAKAGIPIVVSGDKIVWVAGYGIAEDVKVTKGTKKILKLRLLKDEQDSGFNTAE